MLPGRRKVIFVHGCFWHAHGCSIGQPPKSRLDFWKPKLATNQDRDRKNEAALRGIGWGVETVWQCETKDLIVLERRLISFVESGTEGDRQSPKFALGPPDCGYKRSP